MITLTVEKDWTGKYTFIVSNGFDSQSFTPELSKRKILESFIQKLDLIYV